MSPMLILATKRSRRRGFILAVTFFFVMLTSIGALLLTRTLMDQQRLNQRRRDHQTAFYAAEAGVAQVLHWGNFPAEYTPNITLFYRNPSTGAFPSLAGLTETSIQSDLLDALDSSHSYSVSHVEDVTLLPPAPGTDPITCLFKVQSVGECPSGIQRTVLAYIQANPLSTTEIVLPAALLSLKAGAMNGNAKIHWGESWSKSTFDMLNQSQMGYLSSDPWARYRSEGAIDFAGGGWQVGEGKDLYDLSRRWPGTAPASGTYATAFEQLIPAGTLEWPDLLSEYATFKDMAISRGRYYSTDASGNIYRDGVEDAGHQVDFVTEFEIADRATAPYDFFFIDTIDGNAPASDGSNLATVTSSGTSTGLKGVFWIGANFGQTGVGTPPTLAQAEKPDGSKADLTKIYLDGVLFAAGTIDLGGNAGVYGSVVAERGFAGAGTPDVYYNHKLAAGLEIPNGNVGSVFKVALQSSY